MRILRAVLGVGGSVVVVIALLLAVVGCVGGLYAHDHGTLEVAVDGERVDSETHSRQDGEEIAVTVERTT